MTPEKARIGIVSTRLAGTDGVSLETAKWVHLLRQFGHDCFFFAGESDWPADQSYIVSEAHFHHPEIQALNADLFDDYRRTPATSASVSRLKNLLKEHLHRFTRQFEIDLLIAENALALPMNVPLGLALTEFIAETDMVTIAHHHDFHWERSRYAVSAADDYLRAAFPPTLHPVRHVVINSFAARQLALRSGIGSTLIPNVMDFQTPPPPLDDYARQFRTELGIEPEEYLLLQPTRIVPRKRIEKAIELARRIDLPCALVVSHSSGDEGKAYETYLQEYAQLMGVHLILAADRIDYERGTTTDGRPIFSLADVYQQAALVTYPSLIEGFGNAFLETIYYRRPIVVSAYEIFKTDIQPKGFQVIEFDQVLTDETVNRARDILRKPELAAEMVGTNFELGKRYYSYQTLERRLAAMLNECLGLY